MLRLAAGPELAPGAGDRHPCLLPWVEGVLLVPGYGKLRAMPAAADFATATKQRCGERDRQCG